MSYNVRATRWKHGWKLDIDGVGVTQSHSLSHAEAVARDHLECLDRADAATADISVVPDLGSLNDEVRKSRQATADAEKAQRQAAAASRRIAATLRRAGLSVRDTAQVLGVSPARVSQLTSNEAGRRGAN